MYFVGIFWVHNFIFSPKGQFSSSLMNLQCLYSLPLVYSQICSISSLKVNDKNYCNNYKISSVEMCRSRGALIAVRSKGISYICPSPSLTVDMYIRLLKFRKEGVPWTSVFLLFGAFVLFCLINLLFSLYLSKSVQSQIQRRFKCYNKFDQPK